MKIAICGCGNIAEVHIKEIRSLGRSDLELCAVDIDDNRLQAFCEKHGIKNSFNDLDDMLREFKPDVVHIVTPPMLHKTLAIKCLENNAHVLIEKPICISRDEALDIIKAASDNNRFVTVDHTRLYDPLIIKAVNLIKDKGLGRVVNVNVSYFYDYDQRLAFDPATRWMNSLPGGPVFDLMPHLFSAIEVVVGKVEPVNHFCVTRSNGNVESLWCLLRADKSLASINLSLMARPLKNQLDIECENGNVLVDLRNFQLVVRPIYNLPNAVERVVGNIHVSGQYFSNTFSTIFNFIRGKLDPYEGLKEIIRRHYSDVAEGKQSLGITDDAARYLTYCENYFSSADEQAKVYAADRMKPLAERVDVMVTGGTGFIGSHVVKKLLDEGHSVRVFTHRDIDPEEIFGAVGKNVEIARGDIYRKEDVLKACSGAGKVVHLAAAMQGAWAAHLDTTITGTKNILESCKECEIDKLVYVSTLNVYEAQSYRNNEVVTEDFRFERYPNRRGSYSAAKLEAEKLVNQFAANNPDIKIDVLRPGLVYGPGLDPVLKDLGIRLGKNWMVGIGGGGRKLPLTFVGNLVDACVFCLEKTDGSATFNIVDSDYPTQKAYLKTYNQLAGTKIRYIPVPFVIYLAAAKTADVMGRVLLKRDLNISYRMQSLAKGPVFSTESVRKIVGWEPKVSMAEGLRGSIEQRLAEAPQ